MGSSIAERNRLERVLYRLEVGAKAFGTAGAALAGVGIVVLMTITVIDVGLRAMSGRGLAWSVEAGEVALAAVAALGLVAAQFNARHISTPILTNRLPGPAAHVTRAIAALLAAALMAWMFLETLRVGIASTARGEIRYGSAQIAVWPAKLIIPICIGGLAIALLLSATAHIIRFYRQEPAEASEFDSLA